MIYVIVRQYLFVCAFTLEIFRRFLYLSPLLCVCMFILYSVEETCEFMCKHQIEKKIENHHTLLHGIRYKQIDMLKIDDFTNTIAHPAQKCINSPYASKIWISRKVNIAISPCAPKSRIFLRYWNYIRFVWSTLSSMHTHIQNSLNLTSGKKKKKIFKARLISNLNFLVTNISTCTRNEKKKNKTEKQTTNDNHKNTRSPKHMIRLHQQILMEKFLWIHSLAWVLHFVCIPCCVQFLSLLMHKTWNITN